MIAFLSTTNNNHRRGDSQLFFLFWGGRGGLVATTRSWESPAGKSLGLYGFKILTGAGGRECAVVFNRGVDITAPTPTRTTTTPGTEMHPIVILCALTVSVFTYIYISERSFKRVDFSELEATTLTSCLVSPLPARDFVSLHLTVSFSCIFVFRIFVFSYIILRAHVEYLYIRVECDRRRFRVNLYFHFRIVTDKETRVLGETTHTNWPSPGLYKWQWRYWSKAIKKKHNGLKCRMSL